MGGHKTFFFPNFVNVNHESVKTVNQDLVQRLKPKFTNYINVSSNHLTMNFHVQVMKFWPFFGAVDNSDSQYKNAIIP